MKIKFDCNLEAWATGIEIEADSYEDALAELHSMTFEELVEAGYEKDFKLDDIDGSIIERTVKVKVYDIEYDVEYGEADDYESPEAYIQFINSLPSSLTLTLTVEPDDDIEDLIADEILYETNWVATNFRFIILEEN